MKHLCIFFILISSITTMNGQSIVGQWETFDDKTKEKKAVIEVYQTDDLYFAKIVKSYVGEKNAICETCKGTQKNKPIIGLVIIENIKKDGNEFNGGSILDPENGETYKCYLKLMNNNKLKVRGYLGLSIFGRTQYWVRKE
jgi:uncharacterized protein (DUF2147 family)